MDSDHEPRIRWVAAALLCSAVLFYFGTGLAPIAALTWVAPLPVLVLAPRVRAGVALGAAFLAYFLGTANSWGFYLQSHDVPLPLGLLLSAAFSLTFLVAVWIFRMLLRRGRAPLAVTAASAAWVGVLYVASVSNPRGMLGTLATAQGDVPVVLQVASVTGAWGVDFFVLFLPMAVAAPRCTPASATGSPGSASLWHSVGCSARFSGGARPRPVVRVTPHAIK
jgi:apolipoprotein N-acyltransferase